MVDTSDCPASATEPIEDEVFIGSAMPLSGGVAAAAFEPAARGFYAYIDTFEEAGVDLKEKLTGRQMEVLTKDYMPVEGLYAAGCCAGGYLGGSCEISTTGGSCGFAVFTGRTAGRSAGGSLPRR